MKKTVGPGATFGFALAIVALLVSGWLSYRNLLRISRNEKLVVHTHEVLDGLREVIASLATAESNQRSRFYPESSCAGAAVSPG
jgi:CHASE3 domain sensor protein